MKKTSLLLIALFCLSAVSAATWQTTALIGVLAVVFLAVFFYMLGTITGAQSLKIIAKEELMQVLLAGILIAAFTDLSSALSNMLSLPGGTSVKTTAEHFVNNVKNELTNTFAQLKSTTDDLGKEGSKSITCSLVGFVYSVSNCGGFYYLSAPFVTAYRLIAVGIVEINVLSKLLEVASSNALSVIMPLGLLLLPFQVTRGAGAVLIGIGLSLYIVLPYTIYVMKLIIDEQTNAITSYSSAHFDSNELTLSIPSAKQCEEYQFGSENEDEAVEQFKEFASDKTLIPIIHLFLLKTTVLVITSIGAFIKGAEAFAQIFNTRVDLSTLQRLI